MRGFRITSARRHERSAPGSGWIIAGIALTIVALAVIGGRRGSTPIAVVTPAAIVPPTATALPTMTPTVTPHLELGFTSLVVRPPPTVTPTPTWPPAQPTRTPRRATPTPGASTCVAIGFTTSQVMAPQAHVLVQIDARNRCGRVLEAGELWFEIRGWRNGAVIQTAIGSAFDSLYRGGSVQAAIGLPGSADWYDRIDVRVLDAPP